MSFSINSLSPNLAYLDCIIDKDVLRNELQLWIQMVFFSIPHEICFGCMISSLKLNWKVILFIDFITWTLVLGDWYWSSFKLWGMNEKKTYLAENPSPFFEFFGALWFLSLAGPYWIIKTNLIFLCWQTSILSSFEYLWLLLFRTQADHN